MTIPPHACLSVDLPQPPAYRHHPRPYKTYHPQSIASAAKRNQRCVTTPITSDELSGNRYASETAETDHSIQRRVPSSKHLGPAQLPNTDGCKADVRAAGEAKDKHKGDELR